LRPGGDPRNSAGGIEESDQAIVIGRRTGWYGAHGKWREFILAVAFLSAVYTLFVAPQCTDALLRSDAADYLKASRAGFWANYADTGAMDPVSLVRRRSSDREFREHPWAKMLRESDLAAFRHFHTAASLYPHAIAAAVNSGNRIHRLIPSIYAMILGCLVIAFFRQIGGGVWLGIFIAVLLLSRNAVAATATAFSPHALFLVLEFAFLGALGLAVDRRDKQWLLGAIGILAAAVASMELSFMLVAAACLALLVSWRSAGTLMGILWQIRLKALAVFTGVLFLLWPGGFWNGGYAVSYGTFGFQILIRAREYFDPVDAAVIASRASGGNPMEIAIYVTALAAGVYLFVISGKKSFAGILVLMYCFLTLVQGYNNAFSNPTYVSHWSLAVWFLIGLCLHGISARLTRPGLLRAGKAAMLLGAVALVTVSLRTTNEMVERAASRDARGHRLVRLVESRLAPGSVLIVNRHRPSLSTYVPGIRVWHSRGKDTLAAQFPEDEAGAYYLADIGAMDSETSQELASRWELCPAPPETDLDGILISCAVLRQPRGSL